MTSPTPLNLTQIVRLVYQDFQFPAAYGSARRMYKFLKHKQAEIRNNPLPSNDENAFLFNQLPSLHITEETIQESMDTITAFVQNQQIRYKGKNLKIVVPSLYHSISIDLMFMDKATRKYNDGFHIILVCLLDFSRKIFARPLKTKQSKVVTEALDDIIQNEIKYPPTIIHSDFGNEFNDLINQKYIDSLIVGKFKDKRRKPITTRHIQIKSKQKAILVERAILRLRRLISKYQDLSQKYNWVDKLQAFVKLLNQQPVSSLGNIIPSEVNINNQGDVLKDIYLPLVKQQFNELKRQPRKTKLQLNDIVRLVKGRKQFQKTGDETTYDQLYQINHIYPTSPISYQLRYYSTKKLFTDLRRVYRHQLRRVRLHQDEDEGIIEILRNESFYRNGELYYHAYFKSDPLNKNAVLAKLVD